jgi:AcrR family transcriptional regulator
LPPSASKAVRTRKSVARQRRAPRQDRSKATVAAILSASAQILRRQGAEGLTTAAIAKRAGVSVGSLYDYFPSKQAIIIALARQLMKEDVEAIATAAAKASADPVRAIIAALIDRHLTDRSARRKIMAAHIGAGFAAEHAQTVEKGISLLAQRHFPKIGVHDTSVFVATRAVLGVCRSLVDEPEGTRHDLKEIEDALVAIVEKTLDPR